MAAQRFLFLGHQDLSGLLRGRSVPKERRKMALAKGLPWVPGSYSIGPTNVIPPDNPFGQQGEIRLLPAKAAASWIGAELVEAYLACRREDSRQFCSISDDEAASIPQRIYRARRTLACPRRGRCGIPVNTADRQIAAIGSAVPASSPVLWLCAAPEVLRFR